MPPRQPCRTRTEQAGVRVLPGPAVHPAKQGVAQVWSHGDSGEVSRPTVRIARHQRLPRFTEIWQKMTMTRGACRLCARALVQPSPGAMTSLTLHSLATVSSHRLRSRSSLLHICGSTGAYCSVQALKLFRAANTRWSWERLCRCLEPFFAKFYRVSASQGDPPLLRYVFARTQLPSGPPVLFADRCLQKILTTGFGNTMILRPWGVGSF